MISLGLRSGIKIDEIEDQLKGIHCPACQMTKAKGNRVDGLSCPDIMSRTIKEFANSG
jgi:ribonucleoside-diphosphate reductase alpha chain